MKKICMLFLVAPLLLIADDQSLQQQLEADQAALNQAAADEQQAAENEQQAAQDEQQTYQSENQSGLYNPDNPAGVDVNMPGNNYYVAPGAYDDRRLEEHPYEDQYLHDQYQDHRLNNAYRDEHLNNQYEDHHLNNQYEDRYLLAEN